MSNNVPQSPQPPSHSMHYFIGLGIGAIPLVLLILGIGTSTDGAIGLFFIGVILYMIVLVLCIITLCFSETRFLGYGLLTMVVASPVIFFIACMVTLSHSYV